jgi:hypothetical protein
MSEFFPLPFDLGINLNTTILANMYIDNELVQNLQGTPTTNEDLKVGSPTINAINQYTDNINPNIPRISIWAEENSPVHWRMFSKSKWPNEPDTKLVNKVNLIRGSYNAHYHFHRAAAVFYITIFGHTFSLLNPIAGYKAQQWKKGRNWIDNSENIWSALIKTTRREPQTYWVNVWVPCPYPPIAPYPMESANRNIDPDCGEWKWVQRTRYISVNYPSDGLLPQYTQELKGIPSGNRYKVNGANHLEVRNMSAGSVDETAIEFRKIFNRPSSDWFHTD